MKKNYKFLNLCGLSTEIFLVSWPSQYKFLTNEFLIKEKCAKLTENFPKNNQVLSKALSGYF